MTLKGPYNKTSWLQFSTFLLINPGITFSYSNNWTKCKTGNYGSPRLEEIPLLILK